MRCHPGSTRINHVANGDAECSAPVELAQTQERLFSWWSLPFRINLVCMWASLRCRLDSLGGVVHRGLDGHHTGSPSERPLFRRLAAPCVSGLIGTNRRDVRNLVAVGGARRAGVLKQIG